MEEKNLLNDYYILATLQRQVPILLCVQKHTYKYKFFQIKQNKICCIDNDLGLNKVYTSKSTSIFYELKVAKSDKFVFDSYDTIEKFVQNEELIKKIHKINFVNNMSQCSTFNAVACYNAYDKTIYFNGENCNRHIFVHEMLHALTDCGNNLGFTSIANLEHHTTESLYACTSIGYALNEGATEYYTRQICDDYTNAYDFLVFIYEILNKVCDAEVLKDLYLSSNFSGFIDYMCKSFHIDSKEPIIRFTLLLDCYLSSAKYNQDSDMKTLSYEIYKELFSLLACKHQTEKTTELIESTYKNIIDKVKHSKSTFINMTTKMLELAYLDCKAYKTKIFKSPKSSNFNEMQLMATKFIQEVSLTGKYTGRPFNKEMISDGILNLILSESVFYRRKDDAEGYNIVNLYKYLFNPQNNIFPKDKTKLKEFVSYAILSREISGINIQDFMPKQLINSVIKQDEQIKDYLTRNTFSINSEFNR